MAALPGGAEILLLDGDVGTAMKNDLPYTNRYKIIFGSVGSSRTISGTTENTFYDYSSNKPKIENNSSNLQTIAFPLKWGNSVMELNPVNGDLAITSAINNNGIWTDVWGGNGKILSIASMSGSGGLSIKSNPTTVKITGACTYSGNTYVEYGTLELQASIASSNVTVKSGATLKINGTNITVASLTIESGGYVEVAAGKSLTVTGTLANSVNSGLIIKSGASLIQSSASVSATVERDISAWTDAAHGWHLLSSPVTTLTVANSPFNPGATDDFYAWSEPDNLWLNQKVTPIIMTPGNGYMVAYANTATKQFIGTLNSSDITLSGLANHTGTNHGWHLLGNPFPCALHWGNSTWVLNNISGAAKIWNESTATYVEIATDEIIPALNGFMVETSGSGSLTIPLNERAHDGTAFYKSSSATAIKLVAHDVENQTAQESIIRVNAAATDVFDPAFDSHFLAGYAPQFYSVKNSENLSTQNLPNLDNRTIPMVFVKNGASTFSIELAKSIPGIPVYLLDKKTNIVQNLSENPVYTFTSAKSDDPARFVLSFFNPTGLDKPVGKDALQIYATAGKINVSGAEAKGEIIVRNMLGQVILRSAVNGKSLYSVNTAGLPVGVYVVSVVSGTQVKSQKVVISE